MFSSCVADVQMTSSLLKESRRVFWISKFSWHFWPLISADSDRLRNFASFFKLMNLLLQRIWNKLRGSKNFLKQIEAHLKKTNERKRIWKQIWKQFETNSKRILTNLKRICEYQKRTAKLSLQKISVNLRKLKTAGLKIE